MEQTLVLIKPDAMRRGLAGEIIARMERVGLRIVKCRVVYAEEELVDEHYPVTDEWYLKVGNNTLDDCRKYCFDPVKTVGTDDPKAIGKLIHKYNKEFLMSGPILALVFEGNHAIEVVRKLVGHTIPVLSPAGTIRGDYSNESAVYANLEKRSIHNLVHASGNLEEAKMEIELWFSKD